MDLRRKKLVGICDAIFAEKVKDRDKHRCQKCLSRDGLACAHYIGRENFSVRWYFDNATTLCYECHGYFHKNINNFKVWFLNLIGTERMEKLIAKSNEMYKKSAIVLEDEKNFLEGVKYESKN